MQHESLSVIQILLLVFGPVMGGIIVIITRPWWENTIRKYLIIKEISSELIQLKSFPNTMLQQNALHEVNEIRCYIEHNQNVLKLSLKKFLICRLNIIEERIKMGSPAHNNLDNAIDYTLDMI